MKLMSYIMKLWEEKLNDDRVKNQISQNQPASTVEAIYILRRLMERCRENKIGPH